MQIADCVEQSCELVEAYYCFDITVALIVLNLVELKTLVLILWVSTRCVFIYTVLECLCIRLLYCLWFCKAQGSFRPITCVRRSFTGLVAYSVVSVGRFVACNGATDRFCFQLLRLLRRIPVSIGWR